MSFQESGTWGGEIARAWTSSFDTICFFIQGGAFLRKNFERMGKRIDKCGFNASPSGSNFICDHSPSNLSLGIQSPATFTFFTAGTATSVSMFKAVVQTAGKLKPKHVWLGTLGMAAAASLSAAMAAVAAEIPMNEEVLKTMTTRVGKSYSPAEPSTSRSSLQNKRKRSESRSETLVEPRTKVHFPLLLSDEQIKSSEQPNHQILAGVGMRSKSILKLKSIKIYAFGLYVDPEGLQDQLGVKYTNITSQNQNQRRNICDDLLSSEVGMTLQLVVHFKGLNMDMVRSAFETSLRNRLRKIKGTEEDDGLKMFTDYFSQPLNLTKGTIINFRRRPGGVLETEIAGKRMEPILSPHLCRAFFDIYIGDPPVCGNAKEQVENSVLDLLSSGG